MKPFIVEELKDKEKINALIVGIGRDGHSILEYVNRKSVHDFDSLMLNSSDRIDTNHLIDILDTKDIVFVVVSIDDITELIMEFFSLIKKLEILSIVIVINETGNESSQQVLNTLEEKSDSVIKLSNIYIEDNYYQAVKIIDGVLGVLLVNGDNDINLDFDDLRTVLQDRGIAYIGVSESIKVSALETMQQAVSSSLLDQSDLRKVKGVLVHFKVHPEFSFLNLSEAMEIIHESVHEDADVIWGTSTDSQLDKEYIQITLIVTGFHKSNNKYISANNLTYNKT